jgi:hypothetical protein
MSEASSQAAEVSTSLGVWKKRWVTIMMDVPCNQFWFDFWYRYRNLDCWSSRCISCKMENHWLKKIARIKSMNTVRFMATKIYLLWRYRVYGISCLSEGHTMMAQPACNKEKYWYEYNKIAKRNPWKHLNTMSSMATIGRNKAVVDLPSF